MAVSNSVGFSKNYLTYLLFVPSGDLSTMASYPLCSRTNKGSYWYFLKKDSSFVGGTTSDGRHVNLRATSFGNLLLPLNETRIEQVYCSSSFLWEAIDLVSYTRPSPIFL